MKKVVRLTESELVSLIKRVLKEDGGLDGIMNKVPAGSKGQGTPGGSRNPAPVDNSQSKTFPDEPTSTSTQPKGGTGVRSTNNLNLQYPKQLDASGNVIYPIKIKIKTETGEELLADIYEYKKTPKGCVYNAKLGSTETKIWWEPTSSANVIYRISTGTGTWLDSHTGSISTVDAPAVTEGGGNIPVSITKPGKLSAATLLSMVCGDKDYASIIKDGPKNMA